jgi:hypothetical protein
VDFEEIISIPHGDIDPDADDISFRSSGEPEIRMVEVRRPRRRPSNSTVTLRVFEILRDESLRATLAERLSASLLSVATVTNVHQESPGVWVVQGDPTGEELARVAAAVVDEMAPQMEATIPTMESWLNDLKVQGLLTRCSVCGREHPPSPAHRNPWRGPLPTPWSGYPPRFEQIDFSYEVWATEDSIGSSFEMNPNTDRSPVEVLDRLIENIKWAMTSDQETQLRLDSPHMTPVLEAPAGYLICEDPAQGYGVGYGNPSQTHDGRAQKSPYVYSDLTYFALLDLERRRKDASPR